MKRKMYLYGTVLVCMVLSFVFAVVLVIPELPGLISGGGAIIRSMLITAQGSFPSWHKEIVYFWVFLSLVGFICMFGGYVFLICWFWKKLPSYQQNNKQEYLSAVLHLVMLGIVITGLLVAEYVVRYQTNKMYGSHFGIGVRLSPPSTWNQKDTADERGMNYTRLDWQTGDTLHTVNKQGFFARFNYDKETIDSFKQLGYTIVFIIGDSYTEGVTTGTFDRTFCELAKKELLPRKILLCPFGVGGTDVIQYRLVAEKFIPELKPDMVIIGFCGCNDFISWDRIPTPGVPLCYQTNVGYLNSNVGYNAVLCPTRDSLYRYYKKFAPGTSSLRLLRRCQALFDGIREPEYEFPGSDTSTATWRNLAKVRALSDSVGAQFLIAFTPDINIPTLRSQREADSLYAKNFGDLQRNARYYLRGDMTYDDYMTPTTTPHFNDAGNRKFATFLEELILKEK